MPDHASARSDLFMKLRERQNGSLTATLSKAVVLARAFSEQRNRKLGIRYNRDLQAAQLMEASGLPPDEFKKLVDSHTPKFATRRTLIRSLRVARTLADLDGQEAIEFKHLSQAWQWLPDSTEKDRESYAYGI